jgi:hypothetical protein
MPSLVENLFCVDDRHPGHWAEKWGSVPIGDHPTGTHDSQLREPLIGASACSRRGLDPTEEITFQAQLDL